MIEDDPESLPLNKVKQKFIQKVTGKCLYLGRPIGCTLLIPLSAIASQQKAPTQRTMQYTEQLLDYTASQKDAVLTYRASGMILAAHSDAEYHNEPGARSRSGGHFYLSNNAEVPPNNGRQCGTDNQSCDAFSSRS